MTQESILPAKVLATNALAFNLGVLRHVMSPQVVGPGKGKRTLFANESSRWSRDHWNVLYIVSAVQGMAIIS